MRLNLCVLYLFSSRWFLHNIWWCTGKISGFLFLIRFFIFLIHYLKTGIVRRSKFSKQIMNYTLKNHISDSDTQTFQIYVQYLKYATHQTVSDFRVSSGHINIFIAFYLHVVELFCHQFSSGRLVRPVDGKRSHVLKRREKITLIKI